MNAHASPYPKNSNTVHVNCENVRERGCVCGLKNPGYWGVPVKVNQAFLLQFYVRLTDDAT